MVRHTYKELSCIVLAMLIRALGLFKCGPGLWIEMGHFKGLVLVPTFGIETLISQRAIENTLVTAHFDSNTV